MSEENQRIKIRWACLDGSAEFAQQRADGWAKDDQASDGDDGNKGDDQTVLDQTLTTIARNRGKRGKHLAVLSLWGRMVMRSGGFGY